MEIKYNINNVNNSLYIPGSSSFYINSSEIQNIQSEVALVFKDQHIYKKIVSNVEIDNIFYGLPLQYYTMSYAYLMQLINFTKINDTCLKNKLQPAL